MMKRMIAMSLLAVVGCKKKEEKAAAPGTAPATAPGTAPATASGTAPGTAPAAATGEYKLNKAADLKWTPLMPDAPGPEIAVVEGDPMTGAAAFFMRIPPKGEAGIHTHTAGYRATLVSGAHKHWLPGEKDVKALAPGSWWYQPGGQPHGDTCEGPDPCIAFIVTEGKFDMAPAADAKDVTDKGAYKLVKAEDLKFAFGPGQSAGPKFAYADGDPMKGPVAFQIEWAAADNGAVPLHSHTSGYHAVVLAGAPAHWVDGAAGKDEGLAVGSHWFQPGVQVHGDACTGDAPCKLFIWMTGGQDFIPKPAAP